MVWPCHTLATVVHAPACTTARGGIAGGAVQRRKGRKNLQQLVGTSGHVCAAICTQRRPSFAHWQYNQQPRCPPPCPLRTTLVQGAITNVHAPVGAWPAGKAHRGAALSSALAACGDARAAAACLRFGSGDAPRPPTPQHGAGCRPAPAARCRRRRQTRRSPPLLQAQAQAVIGSACVCEVVHEFNVAMLLCCGHPAGEMGVMR